MRCIRPLRAALGPDNKLTYTQKFSKDILIPIGLECRKCLPCRLNIAREKAVRCFHETQMHQDAIFLTLTYSEENLTSNKLNYEDFQLFMKRLRTTTPNKITYMVTGEYGEKNKRPHWHAIIFNYRPPDSKPLRTTDLDHLVSTSALLDELWGFNDSKLCPSQFGEVTIDSASYVARYAAKKLVHGPDESHEYHPIHKTSSKRAIGRSWIEKHYEHTFKNGFVVLPDGTPTKIPRYYVDWCKKHKPDLWSHYVTQVRPKIIDLATDKQTKEDIEYVSSLMQASSLAKGARYIRPVTRSKVKETILKSKFKQLQEKLKL